MLRLVLGAALVYAAIFIAAMILDPDLINGEDRELASVALSAFVVPVVATWLVAELVSWASPRRLFDRRIPGTLPRLARGVVGAVFGSIVGALALALLDQSLPDALITGLSSAAGAAIVLVPLQHARRGTCIHCGYDLSGATVAPGGAEAPAKPVCPECGADVMLAMTGARSTGAIR